jgi:hypothetical protein
MKLSKYYLLNRQKAIKLSPLHCRLSLPTRKFEEKKDSFEIVCLHTKVIFSPPKSMKKDQNMTILGYSCSLQSSLYTKSHRFTLKSLIFCPKTIATLVFETLNLSKLYPKKGTSDKSNEK